MTRDYLLRGARDLERCEDTARDIRVLVRERQSARELGVIYWFLAL